MTVGLSPSQLSRSLTSHRYRFYVYRSIAALGNWVRQLQFTYFFSAYSTRPEISNMLGNIERGLGCRELP